MSAPRFQFTLVTPDGDELKISLPAKFEVCPRCEGKGTHVNPTVDGNGLSSEDFDADPDFHESYMRGDYDIQCQECHGARVVSVVNDERLTAEQRAQYEQHLKDEAEYQRDYDSEAWLRRAESGERW